MTAAGVSHVVETRLSSSSAPLASLTAALQPPAAPDHDVVAVWRLVEGECYCTGLACGGRVRALAHVCVCVCVFACARIAH